MWYNLYELSSPRFGLSQNKNKKTFMNDYESTQVNKNSYDCAEAVYERAESSGVLSSALAKIKYPKLSMFAVTVAVAIVLFYEASTYESFNNFILSLGYIGTFFAGVFYAYGFTAAPATAVLLLLAKEQHLFIAVLIGGLGALLSDLLIFNFVRHSFIGEIRRLKEERFMKFIAKKVKGLFGRFYKYVFPAIASFLIASPLPTEVGVTMMASLRKLSLKKFMVIAYFFHSLGMLIILTIGNFL